VSFRYLAFHPSRLRLAWLGDTATGETEVVLTIALDGRTFLLGPENATITADERADRRRPAQTDGVTQLPVAVAALG